MTYWVHRKVGRWDRFNPPRQEAVPGRGFPVMWVEIDGFEFEFASLAEIEACIEVLGRRLLPRTLDLSHERRAGPNSHWLSRLPARVKPWRYRERAVRYLEVALADFRREIQRS